MSAQKSLTEFLDEIEERANKATPGPWHIADDPKFPGKLHCVWGDMTEDITGRFGTLVGRTCFAPNSEANSTLMASARTDIPALVKALGRAIERSAALESAVLSARDFMDYLRTNTGFTDEWPIELKAASDAIPKLQGLLNEFEATVYAVAPSVVSGKKSATASFIPISDEIAAILNQGRTKNL